MILHKNNKIDNDWIARVCRGDAIYDWNIPLDKNPLIIHEPNYDQLSNVVFRSECFRDALGNALRLPSKNERQEYILNLMEVGVEMVTLDIYSSNGGGLTEGNLMTLEILEWMKVYTPKIRPVVLVRAVDEDLKYLEKAYQINPLLIGLIFQDLSEVRRVVEGWGSFNKVLKSLENKVRDAKKTGMSVMAFTENLSITPPAEIKKYVESMCKAGADWVGIADTAGRLTPFGTTQITHFVYSVIEQCSTVKNVKKKVGIVFHAHNDWGNAVNNSIAAIASGASIIDVVTNGIGERAGNTNLIEMIANIEYRLRSNERQSKRVHFDLSKVIDLSRSYSRITATQFGSQQPLVGDKVFSTTFGIHGNYYYKVAALAATMRGDGVDEQVVSQFESEAWRVYSASSPSDFNIKPDVRISQLSGASNVIMRLYTLDLISDVREIEKGNPLVQKILEAAKAGWGELDDEIVKRIWQSNIENV